MYECIFEEGEVVEFEFGDIDLLDDNEYLDDSDGLRCRGWNLGLGMLKLGLDLDKLKLLFVLDRVGLVVRMESRERLVVIGWRSRIGSFLLW